MAPYIYGKRNAIHIIDIRETLKGMLRAQKLLGRVVSSGQDVLFVGTKRQARESVAKQAQRCGMHYVNERWLGGTLTNFRTIRSRLERLEELEALVSSPKWETGYSKKMKATLSRELKKIQRNLQGIRRMERLPGVLVVIDVRKEINAVREAKAMSIPTICMIDTDGDPDFASIPIPCNDDAMRGIDLLIARLADAVEEGRRARPAVAEPAEPLEAATAGSGPRRRSRRPARAEAFAGAPASSGPAGAPTATPEEPAHFEAPGLQPESLAARAVDTTEPPRET